MTASALARSTTPMSPARLYWYRGSERERRNFGDSVAPLLLRSLSGREPVWCAGPEAELVTIGSVMSQIPDRWSGVVLGTGTIRAGLRRDLSRARVLAVRGARTREACALPPRTALGDPGILVPDLFPDVRRSATVPVVVVPHYVDKDLARRYPTAERVDILSDHRTVLAGIARGRLVVTSSLHAMIAADALGVPHMVEPHPRVIGGLWKFEDYASAFGSGVRPVRPGVRRLTDRSAMVERKAEMRSLYHSLRLPNALARRT